MPVDVVPVVDPRAARRWLTASDRLEPDAPTPNVPRPSASSKTPESGHPERGGWLEAPLSRLDGCADTAGQRLGRREAGLSYPARGGSAEVAEVLFVVVFLDLDDDGLGWEVQEFIEATGLDALGVVLAHEEQCGHIPGVA